MKRQLTVAEVRALYFAARQRTWKPGQMTWHILDSAMRSLLDDQIGISGADDELVVTASIFAMPTVVYPDDAAGELFNYPIILMHERYGMMTIGDHGVEELSPPG